MVLISFFEGFTQEPNHRNGDLSEARRLHRCNPSPRLPAPRVGTRQGKAATTPRNDVLAHAG
jgi:hypothetical protein